MTFKRFCYKIIYMEAVEILEGKVEQAAKQLSALKKERRALDSELRFLEEENKRIKNTLRTVETWPNEKKLLVSKIEKIIKKIDTLAEF